MLSPCGSGGAFPSSSFWVVVLSRSLRVGNAAALCFGLVLLLPSLRLRGGAFLPLPFWVVVVSPLHLCVRAPQRSPNAQSGWSMAATSGHHSTRRPPSTETLENGAGDGKKARNFGALHPSRPHPSGPQPFGQQIQVPKLRAPTFGCRRGLTRYPENSKCVFCAVFCVQVYENH